MKVYLVGGAVRDALLNRTVLEKDYVVVGATVDDMLQLKFQPVGKAFPVFLHPKTKDEYALARTEKKVAKGYHGFTFHAEPDVTLEEDLIRRDLTINAMAQDLDTGEIIDPYHGQNDLQQKILRHVSEAFAEDPVRILRLARFAARFQDFTVAPETVELMRHMVDNGEVDALVAERVWKELQSALREPKPEKFFEVLESCGALDKLFPDLGNLSTLVYAVTLTNDPIIRFAVLPYTAWDHYRVPNEYTDLAKLVHLYSGHSHAALHESPEALLNLLEHIDAFRRPERLEPFLIACHALSGEASYPQADRLRAAYAAASSIETGKIAQGLQGAEIKGAIHSARTEAITHALAR